MWPTEQRWEERTPKAEEGTYGVTEMFQILVMILVAPFIGFLVVQMVKNPSAMQETQVRSLGWEDLLEKEMATHSSILAWEIPWMEEPGRLQSTGTSPSALLYSSGVSPDPAHIQREVIIQSTNTRR